MSRKQNDPRRGAGIIGKVLASTGLLLAVCALVLSAPKARKAVFGPSDWSEWDGTAVFLGDSITDYCDLPYYYPGLNAVNQGISGDTTDGMLGRLERSVYAYEPDILVLHGGINDLFRGKDEDRIVENLCAIVRDVHERLPDAEILLQSLYPVAEGEDLSYTGHIRNINARLEELAREYDYKYVDVYSALCTGDGRLDERYSDDGLHPNDAGYQAVRPVLTEAIESITDRGLLRFD